MNYLRLTLHWTTFQASMPHALLTVSSHGFCACVAPILFCSHTRAVPKYRPEIPEPAHLCPGMGLQLMVFEFTYDQNNRYSSGAYVLQSEREDKHA